MKVMRAYLLIATGITGLNLLLSSPVSANPAQAYASGSAVITLMNGASQSVGGEIAAPKGAVFDGATPGAGDVKVSPSLFGTLDTNTTVFANLLVDPGAPALTTSPNANVETAVATIITNAASVAEGVSYTRAWRSGSGNDASSAVQAYASGSSSIVLMNGASQSIGGEIAAPQGAGFLAGLLVTPVLSFATDISTNATAFDGLAVEPGQPLFAPSPNANVEAAVANQIANAASVADGVSYTRAWQSGGGTTTYLQAYASGSAVITLMNGASQSIGGEIAAPQGAAFDNSILVIQATYQGTVPNLSVNTMSLASLTVSPGSATGTVAPASSVEAAVATQITNSTSLSDSISYIRAWRGGIE